MKNNSYMKVRLRKRSDIEGIFFHYVKSGINPQREILRNLVFKFKEEAHKVSYLENF